MPSSSAIILCSSWGKTQNSWKFVTDVAKLLPAGSCWILLWHLLLCVLQFFLLPLWHQVIQPAQFPFGEDEIQQLTDKHQGQDLIERPNEKPVKKYHLTVHLVQLQHCKRHCSYHHWKHNGCLGSLDDPQQHQAAELDDGEEVHLPQWDVAKVNEVRLMFGWHAEQP